MIRKIEVFLDFLWRSLFDSPPTQSNDSLRVPECDNWIMRELNGYFGEYFSHTESGTISNSEEFLVWEWTNTLNASLQST